MESSTALRELRCPNVHPSGSSRGTCHRLLGKHDPSTSTSPVRLHLNCSRCKTTTTFTIVSTG